jgi:hypothetical protein
MGWVANATSRPLYPTETDWYPLHRRVGGPQGRYGRLWKISPSTGFDPRTVQPIASRYTAIPAHYYYSDKYLIPVILDVNSVFPEIRVFLNKKGLYGKYKY